MRLLPSRALTVHPAQPLLQLLTKRGFQPRPRKQQQEEQQQQQQQQAQEAEDDYDDLAEFADLI